MSNVDCLLGGKKQEPCRTTFNFSDVESRQCVGGEAFFVDSLPGDVDDDGHPELLCGTEDFEIRALKAEEVLKERRSALAKRLSLYFHASALQLYR